MRTRSRANEVAVENCQSAPEGAGEPAANDHEEFSVEVHLSKALHGVRNLQRKLADLNKRNGELEQKLESFEQAENVSIQPKRGKKGGPTVSKLQGEVRRLNTQIRVLEKAKHKDRKTIAKLRAREVKEDVAELEDDTECLVGDSPHRMRKLLRWFHDIVLSSSIEEKEECPICMDTLEVNKCVSLPCEHTFCKTCISQVSPGEGVVTCPQCRAVCPRDEIEIVQYTASQQWDNLLDVAKAWAKMDLRRQPDTSEEEGEEEFIDDEPPGDNASSARSASENPLATSPESEADAGGKPSPRRPPPPRAEPPAAPGSRKRRMAVSPESSPLSQPSSAEPEPPGPVTSANVEPGEASALPVLGQDEPIAGSSIHTEGTEVTPTNSQATPKYAESPARDKRKRMEDLAAARKQKRRL